MKKDYINWNDHGWTTIQDADAEKHIIGISCLTEDGYVTEVRKRHNDGEEEILRKKLDINFSLPMKFEDFKNAIEKGYITLK